MIEFKSVFVRNFMSIGNKPLGYKFHNGEINLVIGPNGSGKSCILLDGLTFALFGNAFRKINNDQVINSINEKNCLATVEFSIGKSEFKVERGIKPRMLNIYENGKLRDKESTMPEQQRYLEQNILRLDERTFRQIVILGSKEYVPFMRLKTSHRRTVIEDLLNLSIFSSMGDIIKKRLSALMNEARASEIECRLLENNIQEIQDLLSKVQGGDDAFLKAKQNEINSIRKDVKARQKDIATHEKEVNKRLKSLLEKHAQVTVDEITNDFENQKFKILDMTSQGNALLNRLVKDGKFFAEHDNCPTCHQGIDDAFRAKSINDVDKKIATLKLGMTASTEKLRAVEGEISKVNTVVKEIVELQHTIAGLQNDIRYREAALISINNDILTHTDHANSNVQEFYGKLTAANEKLNVMKQRETELMLEGHQLTYIHELVKDGGIRNKIILTYLPLINSLMLKYLEMMEADINFTFDEGFNETIKNRNRDNFSYDNFSEGQKLRIDLAILFTFREISRLRNSTATNLVIFDEIGDSSLDMEGFEAFNGILREEKEKQCVVIISHSPEKIMGKVDRIYEYALEKNFTTLKSYTENVGETIS